MTMRNYSLDSGGMVGDTAEARGAQVVGGVDEGGKRENTGQMERWGQEKNAHEHNKTLPTAVKRTIDFRQGVSHVRAR